MALGAIWGISGMPSWIHAVTASWSLERGTHDKPYTRDTTLGCTSKDFGRVVRTAAHTGTTQSGTVLKMVTMMIAWGFWTCRFVCAAERHVCGFSSSESGSEWGGSEYNEQSPYFRYGAGMQTGELDELFHSPWQDGHGFFNLDDGADAGSLVNNSQAEC